jgi:NAD(P)H-flavin reductase
MGTEGKLVQRPMSISSSADDLGEYEFFIRLVDAGGFTPLLWQRTVGDPINIKGAKGKFLLQDDGRRALFVASGTGLAPFISMIETLRGRGESRDIVLLHGASHDHDLAWREQLSELANGGGFPLRYVGTISRPQGSPGWSGLTGRVEAIVANQLDEHGLTPENTTIYICGNPDMIAAVEELAIERGFPPEQVRKELYWPKGRSH